MVRFTTIMCLGAVIASSAIAQGRIAWKTVGNWDVGIDTTLENGCYTLASWTGGTVLRLGLNPVQDTFYVLIGNAKWASLQPDQPYDIQIRFDEETPWDITMTGLRLEPDNLVYLHAQSADLDFIDEFMRRSTMAIFYQSEEIEALAMTGSKRAFETVSECQEFVDGGGDLVALAENSGAGIDTSDDPFAK